jgi:hypothetical protein
MVEEIRGEVRIWGAVGFEAGFIARNPAQRAQYPASRGMTSAALRDLWVPRPDGMCGPEANPAMNEL